MIEHYYKDDFDANFGIVESVYQEDGNTYVESSVIGTLHISCCMGFKPEVGMKVELFTDTAENCWILKKA